ncbi:MAG: thioredoxin-dependent thiol peroxidase [Chloroherpetonaceae bacterium]|nr:thioredoxin-dependent thiol peroxidase [Chthonomonadaceae bacterium]MDW8206377.1 thioredoxin-dependent thiol peroxidase [Chloroherpetonaceae bacterium]
MLQAGDPAPDFTVPDQNGNRVTLSELRGRKVVLFFYPKADTPGCTREACGFRDRYAEFEATGAVLLGISPDTSADQQAFATKYGLPMRLLADTDHAVAEQYGAWGEKNNYGRKYMGILRSTFIIDEEGKIAHVFPKVKPDGHAEEVLALLQR